MSETSRLVLASASPQRKQILEQIGVSFDVLPAHVVEESLGDPLEVAEKNAVRKAEAIPGGLVLGVDTLVTIDDHILGKPQDLEQARAFLKQLSGRPHRVIGAIALAREGKVFARELECTLVQFRSIDDRLIDWYLQAEEWQGRAGGYAIQGRGATFVERIEGDYLNVVGLPLARLLNLLPDLVYG